MSDDSPLRYKSLTVKRLRLSFTEADQYQFRIITVICNLLFVQLDVEDICSLYTDREIA